MKNCCGTSCLEETALGCRLWKHCGATPRPEGAERESLHPLSPAPVCPRYFYGTAAACSVGHVWGMVTLKAACSFSTAASAELWAEFLLSSHHCLCWEQ